MTVESRPKKARTAAIRPHSSEGATIPFSTVLDRHMQDPEFKAGFEKRRLIHEIAVAVRSMRENAGLTQAQLAGIIGTSQPTIARLERGIDQRTPRWDVLQRIANAVGKQLRIVFVDPSTGRDNLVEIARAHRKQKRMASTERSSSSKRLATVATGSSRR